MAKEPFSVRLIDATESFVLARITPHVSREPATDIERMGSHLLRGARLHAMHARLDARAVGLREAWLSWRHLADLARAFSGHPDYDEDFGRAIWEFPRPSPARAQIRLACGHRHTPVATGPHLALTRDALDDTPFRRLRTAGRLRATGDFTEQSDGSYTEQWHLLGICSACVCTAPPPAAVRTLTASGSHDHDLKEATA